MASATFSSGCGEGLSRICEQHRLSQDGYCLDQIDGFGLPSILCCAIRVCRSKTILCSEYVLLLSTVYSGMHIFTNPDGRNCDGSTIKSQWDACLDLVSCSYAVIYSEICNAV